MTPKGRTATPREEEREPPQYQMTREEVGQPMGVGPFGPEEEDGNAREEGTAVNRKGPKGGGGVPAKSYLP